MREIKFRAWNTLNNEMWDCDKIVLCGIYLSTSGVGLIDVDDDRNKQPQLIPMQYTGLKDKNGVEIYEGDILNTVDGNLTVIWNKNMATFGIIKKGWVYTHFFGETLNSKNSEVIGNIYENDIK